MYGSSTRTVRPTRPHDHVYDPVYTVSSHQTHQKEAHAARMSTIERVPEYNNMFSDMARYPRHLYRLAQPKPNAEIPVFPREGATTRPPRHDVLAASRLKFFKRPVVPFLQSVPAEILLGNPANPRATREMPDEKTVDEAHLPKTRTVGVQTTYRESSTQTDPYTRDYMTNEGEEDPEILSIAHLTYGKGLPASLEEIKLIHRMREKRAFEKSLPPITDEQNFELRRKLLEERELKEWDQREEEMRKEREQKLEILIESLRARENKAQVLAQARIEAVKQRKLNQRDETFAKIHQQRIKIHRGLAKTREKVEAKVTKRDIVAEHADYASRVYAPMTREGRLPVQNQVVDYGIPLINNFAGLEALERNMPKRAKSQKWIVVGKHAIVKQSKELDSVVVGKIARGKVCTVKRKVILEDGTSRLCVTAPKAGWVSEVNRRTGKPIMEAHGQKKLDMYSTRKELQVASDLAYCDSLLRDKEKEPSEKKRENKYRKFEPPTRAPVAQVTPPENEEPNRAILLLQRLLRGRAVQNSMYQGKQHALHLIRELRLGEEPVVEQPADPSTASDVAFDQLRGDIISHALDFMSKDMRRVAEENKIKVLVDVAIQTRRIREAEESGRRQAEDLLRKKREQQYKALSQESSRAVGRYMDEIFDNAVEMVSHRNAQHQATVKDRFLEKLVVGIEDKNNTATIKVQDLVSDWLFPETERRRKKAQEEIRNRRFINSGHRTAVDLVGSVIVQRDPEAVEHS